MAKTLFQTALVGSYTRPNWLLEATKGYKAGVTPLEQLEELRTQAKLLTIKEIEDSGLDVICDGEQSRTSFFEYLTEQLTGFSLAGSYRFSDGSSYMALRKPVGKIGMNGDPLAAREAGFLRSHTTKQTKIAVISPHFLSKEWEPGGYYATKDAFLEDMVKVCQVEARALSGKADYIQWDDPGVNFFTESRYSDSEAKENMRLAVDTINRVADSVSGNSIKALHCCWGNRKATHSVDGPLSRIYPELLDLKVDILFLELASARHEDDIEVFKEYPSDKTIAGGVIDVKTPDVEPVRIVKKRAERLLKYVDPEKLMLTTDCGFAPTWDSDRIPRSSCYLKLEALSQAARELRAEHGM